ncbi:hypothetical protein HYW44_01175 [Candidatus Daviesbacteria bacterium]|nr:hypothetical protein [Candidatus Daviesbacteria bacterium]
MSEVVFENRSINRSHPGFSDMKGFFMSRNPGAFGAMFGHHAEFELPFPVFLDVLNSGLTKEDARPLEFRYRSTADLLGARNVVVTYGRFEDAWVRMRGDKFPQTYVDDDMAFLNIGSMAWRSYVRSDKLVFFAWHEFGINGLLEEGSGVKLETSRFHLEIADRPEIAIQISRYPDLMKAVVGYRLLTREEDPLTTDLRKVVAEMPGYILEVPDRLPSPAQKQILDYYRMYEFIGEADCHVPTLNEIVAQTELLVPAVQQSYQATWDRLIAQSKTFS